MSSMVLIPGTTLLPSGLLGIVYFIFLCFLFLGISIIADIFMEAIEMITSQTRLQEFVNKDDGKTYHVETPVWNATIANLTLMALGSSAPEILLSVIEALGTLGEPAGPLGASTIVGSAAFNLLVISAVSIIAVDEPKKILDTGVFFITSVFSIFAYVWLYTCLVIASEGIVTVKEAWLTLIFFFILIGLAFLADRTFAAHLEKQKTEEDKIKSQQDESLKIKKNQLRHMAKTKGGDQVIMEVAQGLSNIHTKKISENDQREIKNLF
jgi:solute carrier family 8 (sodium/calcium exchanger)